MGWMYKFLTQFIKKTLKNTKNSKELEHVGLYLMRNPQKFKTINVIAPKKFSFLI